MKAIKDLLITLLLLLSIYFIFNYSYEIMQFVMVNIVYRDETLNKDANVYYKSNNYEYVQLSDNYYPNNKQEILNLFYTALNKGYDELTFYCPTTYDNCIEDVNDISNSKTMLSYVNNFISTYNTYNKIYININSFGRINISIKKIYDSSTIKEINSKIDEIYNSLITDNMKDEEKIKVIHDYIINNTSYDEERAEEVKQEINMDDIHPSNIAYGPLFTGKAICGGYTDAMALFLDKMGIPNIKVASSNHIWNAVYLNGEWKHLDLTWDDPVVKNGSDTITYNYFLISTEELNSKNDTQHKFDENTFKELKS